VRKWVLNFIEITILIVISLVCVVVVLQNTVYKNNLVGGYKTYVIASNSMYPVFEYGDIKVWKCRNCGHIHVSEKAPEVCPVCEHPKAYFELKAENY